MAFDTNTYPLPTASAFVDIAQYVPLLLAAIDAELDRSDVWDESEVDIALGYVQDLKAWLVDNLPPPTTPGAAMYAMIRDEKPSGTNGGTFDAGAWRRRDLNTIVSNDGDFVTLASNQVTLPAGTYRARAYVPAYAVAAHRCRLQNVTDGTTTLLGSSGYNGVSSGGGPDSVLAGRFTIASAKTFEVQHRCATSRSTNGFGVAGNLETEIYTVLEIWKEA